MTQYLSLSNSKDKIGFWIGSLENVGQALCYRILTSCWICLQFPVWISLCIGCYDNNPESTGEVADPDVQDAQEPGQHWDIEDNDLLSDTMIGAELYMSSLGKLMQATHWNQIRPPKTE
jgi:hypothetical protein